MRCQIIRSSLLVGLVLAPSAAARLPSRSSYCPALLAYPPRLLVSGSGELGRLGSLPAVVVSFSGLMRLLLALDGGDECVDFVDCLLSVDCAGMIGYILNRALSMVRRLFSLVFSAVA